ncbi:MAG: prepilin-type N-terminal cleavage/methylation domain-containing protein, partial [Myxococcota bacterium]|nr:prepilin-type N-terminal cleavage/methylation domain-containing protein [Myxococcota bacterium]
MSRATRQEVPGCTRPMVSVVTRASNLRPSPRGARRGFTLLEVMVAATMTWRSGLTLVVVGRLEVMALV